MKSHVLSSVAGKLLVTKKLEDSSTAVKWHSVAQRLNYLVGHIENRLDGGSVQVALVLPGLYKHGLVDISLHVVGSSKEVVLAVPLTVLRRTSRVCSSSDLHDTIYTHY